MPGTTSWLDPVGVPRGTPFGKPGPMWASGHHTGQDYPAAVGTPVFAVGPGVVIFAGRTYGPYGGYGPYGNQVKIRHAPGWETWYCHLSRVSVKRGDHVRQGTTLGAVGSTGNVTGPHLHLELRRDGIPVDPVPYIDGDKPTPGAPRDQLGDAWNGSTKATPAPAPGTSSSGSSSSTQDASLGGDLVAGWRNLTLTALAVSAGFGLLVVGAYHAAAPKLKAAAGDVTQAAALAAAPETGGASLGAAAATKGTMK